LYKKEVEGAGIPVDLYKYIVYTLKPIRIEVFVSIIKICIIIFGLYISLGILVNFDGFQELNVVTQTATTIVVSFVPKILKRMCSLNTRRTILRKRRKIDELVDSYLVYTGINMDQENILERPVSERYPIRTI
jgi:predicted transporter